MEVYRTKFNSRQVKKKKIQEASTRTTGQKKKINNKKGEKKNNKFLISILIQWVNWAQFMLQSEEEGMGKGKQ